MITFIPSKGFTFTRDDDTFEVTRVTDSAVFFARTTRGKTRILTSEGIDYWNSKTQVAGMATLRDLGHR